MAGDSGSVTESLRRTINYWKYWIGRSTYKGRWLEVVNRSGQLEKARFYFEKMLGYANHLGLISAAINLNRQFDDTRNKNINLD
jgi:hypothetical protein